MFSQVRELVQLQLGQLCLGNLRLCECIAETTQTKMGEMNYEQRKELRRNSCVEGGADVREQEILVQGVFKV